MSVATRIAALLRPAFLIKALPLVIALALSGFLTYEYNAAIRQGHQMVEHSMQALAAMDRVLSLLQDAETGQRGYVITGEQAYLEPYRMAEGDLAGALSGLDSLVGKNADQHAALQRLQGISARKMAELDSTLALRDRAGFDAARRAILADDGRAEMDQARAVVKEMREREQTILDAAAGEVSARNGRIILVSLIALGISLAGRFASAVVTLRGRFRRRKA